MLRSPLRRVAAAALLAVAARPAAAQQPAPAPPAGTRAAAPSLTADLLADIEDLEKKMMGLVRAMPADKHGWRPGEGARTVGEVVMHVAADNYLMPAALGNAADPASGVKGNDYRTAQAFERRPLGRDAAIAELERSFAYLKRTLTATPPARLTASVSLFGQPASVQRGWIVTTTHLHEHLGQLIAYARSNGGVPPWSQGG